MLVPLAVAVLRWSVIAAFLAVAALFSVQADDAPDTEVRDFALPQLEARLKTMPAGPERHYFMGVLANRSGRIAESIRDQELERGQERERWQWGTGKADDLSSAGVAFGGGRQNGGAEKCADLSRGDGDGSR